MSARSLLLGKNFAVGFRCYCGHSAAREVLIVVMEAAKRFSKRVLAAGSETILLVLS